MLNTKNPTPRQLIAAVAASSFALVWAALQWPWVQSTDKPYSGQLGAWLFVAYFLLLAMCVSRFPQAGRWFGLLTGAALLFFILLVIPAAVGITQFTCTGAGWRCYVEAGAVGATGAILVATCARPMQYVVASGAA